MRPTALIWLAVACKLQTQEFEDLPCFCHASRIFTPSWKASENIENMSGDSLHGGKPSGARKGESGGVFPLPREAFRPGSTGADVGSPLMV